MAAASVSSYMRKFIDCVLRNKDSNNESTTNNERDPNQPQTNRENVFAKFLSPFESYIVSLQSLLIWERPYLSAVALLVVNIAYWIIVTCSRRLYSFVAIVSLLVFLYRAWVYQIWPEIRVPPPEGADTEGWTPVHPQVYSVPEISEHLNDWWLAGCHWWQTAWKLRETQPGLFCSFACGTFAFLAIVGHVVPGVLLVYLAVIVMSFGPGMVLYVFPNTWLHKSNKAHDSGSNDGSLDRDSELDEFLPITSRESDLTLSEHQSLDNPDDVIARDLGLESMVKDAVEQEDSLSHGLGSFPNMEDENSDDEGGLDISGVLMAAAASAALSASSPTTQLIGGNNGIHFVASHFKEDTNSDSDNEEAFIEGLSFSRTPEPPGAVLESSTIRPLAMSSHMSSSRSGVTPYLPYGAKKPTPPSDLLTSMRSSSSSKKLSPTIEVETPSPTEPQQSPSSDLDISEYELVSESELSS